MGINLNGSSTATEFGCVLPPPLLLLLFPTDPDDPVAADEPAAPLCDVAVEAPAAGVDVPPPPPFVCS